MKYKHYNEDLATIACRLFDIEDNDNDREAVTIKIIEELSEENAKLKRTNKEAIPIEQLLSILPQYDDYIHFKTYPDNETMEDIYSKGYENGWNACLKAIKEELEYWREEKELGID